jgi:prevent-host-death family protein
MRQVAVRELNHDTAGVLASVERGEALEITRNGVPIARLAPVSPHPLAALIERGEVRPARHSLPLDRLPSGSGSDRNLSDQIVADRAERL